MPELMHMDARRKQTVIRVDVNVLRKLLFEAGKNVIKPKIFAGKSQRLLSEQTRMIMI